MVDGLYILTGNRTKKPLTIGLSGVGRRLRERNDGGDLTKVEQKFNQNFHYQPPHMIS
jgi:hypothetical protein